MKKSNNPVILEWFLAIHPYTDILLLFQTQLADTLNVNYANIWSVELASFVNLLTVDWAGMWTIFKW